MKRMFLSLAALALTATAYGADAKQAEAPKEPMPREVFDQKYEAIFGQKPSDKTWTLGNGLSPECGGGCGGGGSNEGNSDGSCTIF